MEIQLARPQAVSTVARSSGAVSPPEPEKLPIDRYRPMHLGKKAARVAGWSAVVGGGVLGYMAAQSGSAWAGAGVGAPLGMAVGLVIGGAADIMKSLGGGRGSRTVGVATVVGTLVGGAVTGGLSAWMVASGAGWGVPVLAGVGVLEGAAVGGIVHLLTRTETGETESLVERINEDPVKYNAPSATPYLDALYKLEKKGWSIGGEGLLNYQVKPDPALTVSLSRKKENQSNDLPVEQLPDLIKVIEGRTGEVPLYDSLVGKPLISPERAANLPWGGIPGEDATGWWQVERLRATRDLKEGKALHYAHKEITFTYDPNNPPPMDEFIADAAKTAEAYESAFRDAFDQWTLKAQGQNLCNTMIRLVDEGKFADLESAGKAMATWANGNTSGEEGAKALVALLAPGRPAETFDLMNRLAPDFGLPDTLKASDYLSSRLPMLAPAEQSGARERFLRLTESLGEVKDAVRMDGILGALSGPVYDDYLTVCKQLADNGGDRKPRDLMFDFAMLGAYATSPQDLQAQAEQFGRLLKPLAALGQADQAAPIYATLRSNKLSVDDYLTALKSTADVGRAREQLVPRPSGAPSTVEIDAKVYEPKLEWKSREAVTHLEQVRSQTDAPGFERYQKTFSRLVNASGDLDTARRASGVLQNLSPGRSEAHLAIIEDLARRRGESSPYVLEDYLCAVAGRLPGETLEDGAREYGDLLGGCAGAGFPGEAAPTFALIRAGIESGQAGKETVRSLTDRYVKSLLLTKDGEKSRRLLFAADASSSVQEDQSGVTVGGVRIKRRPRA